MPTASTDDDMVLAVYIPPHAPTPGSALRSMHSKSSFDIFPAVNEPTDSNTETICRSLPLWCPGLMVPPYTQMAGMFMRRMPIMAPGRFLSQPPMASTPSMNWLCVAVSMASAITSRDTREYFIPSVPMEMPSVTVMVPNICGMAPARRAAASAASASGWMPALHGFIVECPLAMPTMGFSKSASWYPMARSIERLGERATPLVIANERYLSVMGTF